MKHAAIIPLAGGAVIGAAQALERYPEWMASWPVFAKNDGYARQYYPDVPFVEVNNNPTIVKGADLITCVPPCSGLSTATPSTARGCQAPQNEHMLRVTEISMMIGARCILIENAPTLYSKGGEPFARRFLKYTKKYGYSMVLYKTSTILHGLPQNRVRSFVILYKGNKIPKFDWIEEKYTPLWKMKPVGNSLPATDWSPKTDELLSALRTKSKTTKALLEWTWSAHQSPITAWKAFTDSSIKHKFKTKPYKYMQEHYLAGDGIMNRSPYLVWDYCNALMWKSAHRMINPAEPSRQFNIRELMNLMGLPKDYKEIPRKDINVLFQNVPVNTVKTLVQEIMRQYDSRQWVKPENDITRINNIKQKVEVI